MQANNSARSPLRHDFFERDHLDFGPVRCRGLKVERRGRVAPDKTRLQTQRAENVRPRGGRSTAVRARVRTLKTNIKKGKG